MLFNQSNKERIVSVFKNSITRDMAMTDKELCDILGVNYQNIIARRLDDQAENIAYFIDQLLEIHRVKVILQEKAN